MTQGMLYFVRTILASGLVAIFATQSVAGQVQAAASRSLPTDSSIPPGALIQPAELVGLLRSSGRPVILQVGSHIMYAEAHIPGSAYAGPAGAGMGLEELRKSVASIKKNHPVVIYCGCCPWGRCPNIRPAYKQLQALGFSQVKVLYLADNFGANWVSKGYPVAK